MMSSTLLDFFNNNSVKYLSPVNTANLVSFKVGGMGKIAAFPDNTEVLKRVLLEVGDEKSVVLGKGTNCYFTDNLFDGTIIVTTGLNDISISDNVICAECGVTLNNLCRFALENELSGLEFAYGIPGTVGGAVCMNASAFGGCFSNIVHSSSAFDYKNKIAFELDAREHNFGTKNSVFRSEPLCVLSTRLNLVRGNKKDIKAKMDEYINRRKTTQPLDLPSAGSTFVRPKNTYASYLIDQAGLKGCRVGGAMVSMKHAGFIVNCGGATAKDVKELINHIKSVVYDKFSVTLEEEIIYLE